uniref:Uncharacterized protein n=1 Tax=Ciona savignyi TaxID=51511 RepID=H2YCY5_CIOSA
MSTKRRRFTCFSCCGIGRKDKYIVENDSIYSRGDTDSLNVSCGSDCEELLSNLQLPVTELLMANISSDCPSARTGTARTIAQPPSPVAHSAEVHQIDEFSDITNIKSVSFDANGSPKGSPLVHIGNRTYRKTPHKDMMRPEHSIDEISNRIVQKAIRVGVSYFLVTTSISRSLQIVVSESDVSTLEELSGFYTVSCGSSDDDFAVSRFVDDLLRDVIGKIDQVDDAPHCSHDNDLLAESSDAGSTATEMTYSGTSEGAVDASYSDYDEARVLSSTSSLEWDSYECYRPIGSFIS